MGPSYAIFERSRKSSGKHFGSSIYKGGKPLACTVCKRIDTRKSKKTSRFTPTRRNDGIENVYIRRSWIHSNPCRADAHCSKTPEKMTERRKAVSLRICRETGFVPIHHPCVPGFKSLPVRSKEPILSADDQTKLRGFSSNKNDELPCLGTGIKYLSKEDTVRIKIIKMRHILFV